MVEVQLDAAVAARMDIEDAVATYAIDSSGAPIEFALVPPSADRGEAQWTVAIHFDCDPEFPERGASGIEPCGFDRDAAEAYYLERIREIQHDVEREASRRSMP